jgi:hypothetical protein
MFSLVPKVECEENPMALLEKSPTRMYGRRGQSSQRSNWSAGQPRCEPWFETPTQARASRGVMQPALQTRACGAATFCASSSKGRSQHCYLLTKAVADTEMFLTCGKGP